jgi:Sigma 54 modulation protein / S30EA ribosomal protein
MQVPLDITFRNSEPSEAIRSEVEKQAKRLEKFHDRITSCHVTVIAPTMKRRHGDLFKIDICVAMPQHKEGSAYHRLVEETLPVGPTQRVWQCESRHFGSTRKTRYGAHPSA